ncbi:hypothetical protein ACHQM5_025162 [Ranunculus cassubicifolius]
MESTMAAIQLLFIRYQLSLRPLNLSDVDDVLVWLTDDQVSHYCRWETYTSKEDALDYITNIAIPHPWYRAICLDNTLLGIEILIPLLKLICRGELGYVVGSSYLGKGIATKAVRMVVDCIFDEWKELERVEALVNVGSQRVLEKAGFVKEGVLRKYCILKGSTRDMVMFSFLKTDPKVE